MFVDPDERNGADYKAFWQALNRGEYQAREFRRIGKGGREVWIQASYNPVLGRNGRPYKIVKLASDITEQKKHSAMNQGQIDAINRSQAVIEFELDGTIVTANENFLNAMGYSLGEIQGRHHSMFVESQERESAAYKAFWDRLKRGEYQTAEYKRIGNGGKEIWIQASYNPIVDSKGNPFKVVKFATDITRQVKQRLRKAELQNDIDRDLGEIASAIDTTNTQITSSVEASDRTASTVQSVASAAEELVASIQEIARQVTEASEVSGTAVDRSAKAGQIIDGLSASADRIGQVIDLINSIASQTNLLALNATIEAARAGEAGKGFAVVASEVKALASQTAKATDEIANQISAVQSATGDVITVIQDINAVIKTLNEASGTIAAAVEEQGAVTQDISSNMQIASNQVAAINNNMGEIAQASKAASEATRKVKEASVELVA